MVALLLVLAVVAIFGATYSYFLYPLILLGLSRQGASATPAPPRTWPRATLIVTAFNEAARIGEKIEQCLALDYAPGQLEIIVASDASTDATDDIVRSFESHGVRLVRPRERLGKENAQAAAIAAASGEILVFSDVATSIEADGLRRIVTPFADPSVGAVSSEDRFLSSDGRAVGEGMYVRYEMWLRGLESRVSGLVGLSGSFFAARREVCEDWDIAVPSDFNTALNAAKGGYRAVTSPQALGYYRDLKEPSKEYQRKVRTVLRGIAAVAQHPEVLNPRRLGLFAFQVWSHKVMRWLVPWCMALLLVVTLLGSGQHPLFALLLLAQIVFYAAALAGHLSESCRDWLPVRVPYYFVQANLAVLHAGYAYLKGERVTLWTPSAR